MAKILDWAKFPIIINVVSMGLESRYEFNEGDKIKCPFCGNEFKIGDYNTFIFDGVPESKCECGASLELNKYAKYENRIGGEKSENARRTQKRDEPDHRKNRKRRRPWGNYTAGLGKLKRDLE